MTTLKAASDKQWLAYYDEIAEEIDDDILDTMDERYGIDLETLEAWQDMPEAYFIDAAKMYKARKG